MAGEMRSGGAGLGARGLASLEGSTSCWAAADGQRGDKLPVSGVSEPVSPAGRQGVSSSQSRGTLTYRNLYSAQDFLPPDFAVPLWHAQN